MTGAYGGVVVLGGDGEHYDVDASHLDPAIPVGKVYHDVATPCDGAADRVVAHSEGPRLPHEEPGETLAVAEESHGAGLVSAAATLHHDGFEPGVEGPGLKETLQSGPEKLTWRIVDVGLE